jgi:hypothetical protein
MTREKNVERLQCEQENATTSLVMPPTKLENHLSDQFNLLSTDLSD